METMTSTVPRGRITGSRAKIKKQNKHGETKYASIFNHSFGVKQGREDFGIGRVTQARGGTILFHKLLSQKNGRKISECLDHLY